MDAEEPEGWLVSIVIVFQLLIYPSMFCSNALEVELCGVSPARWFPADFCRQGALEGDRRAGVGICPVRLLSLPSISSAMSTSPQAAQVGFRLQLVLGVQAPVSPQPLETLAPVTQHPSLEVEPSSRRPFLGAIDMVAAAGSFLSSEVRNTSKRRPL